MAKNQNTGIIVSGNAKFEADVVANGDQAHAEKVIRDAGTELVSKGLTEAQRKLDELVLALNGNGDKLTDPKPILGLVERLKEELAQKNPDKLTLKSFISTIAEETKSVAAIATAALSLKEIVSSVF